MNNKSFLIDTVSLLEKNSISTWVFGGWAEELLEVIAPRDHKDIDLLYPAENFLIVDDFLSQTPACEEISGKHFPHKRAFLYQGIVVELFLVQKKANQYFTNFWDENQYYWPLDTFKLKLNNPKIANKSAMQNYRENYEKLRNK